MGFSDIVHGILDVAGFFPVIGVAADLANAVYYAAEGDWGNAILSGASAVPFAGDMAGAVKLGVKGAEAVESAVKGAKAADAAKAADTAADAAKAAGKSDSAVTSAEKMSSFFTELWGKARDGANSLLDFIKKKIDEIKAKISENKERSCFTGDTLVFTNYGYCPIKEVQKGDDIYSRDEKTGEIGLRKVEEVIRTEAHTIYHIWLDGREEIKTTAYHPVFVKETGWVYARNLQEGHLLETMDGTAQVTKIVKTRHEEPVEVYNLRVEEWETYFVSERQVYVHNCGDHDDHVEMGNETKPYANSRPSFRKGVVEAVWEKAKGPDGLVRDPNDPDVILHWNPGESRKGVWDMGHIPEAKYSEMHKRYMDGELTTKEFVDWYNDIDNYRPELPKNNRSHKYE